MALLDLGLPIKLFPDPAYRLFNSIEEAIPISISVIHSPFYTHINLLLKHSRNYASKQPATYVVQEYEEFIMAKLRRLVPMFVA